MCLLCFIVNTGITFPVHIQHPLQYKETQEKICCKSSFRIPSSFKVSSFHILAEMPASNYQSSSTHFLQISSLTVCTIFSCKIYRDHSQHVAMMGSLKVLLEQENSVYCNGTDPKGKVLALKIECGLTVISSQQYNHWLAGTTTGCLITDGAKDQLVLQKTWLSE